MRRDAEAHAEEDRKRRELIEARTRRQRCLFFGEDAPDLGEKVPLI